MIGQLFADSYQNSITDRQVIIELHLVQVLSQNPTLVLLRSWSPIQRCLFQTLHVCWSQFSLAHKLTLAKISKKKKKKKDRCLWRASLKGVKIQ